jgi:hypothetical protein
MAVLSDRAGVAAKESTRVNAQSRVTFKSFASFGMQKLKLDR